jgi:uncharacterized beta-barrel protein YwiB (DUF1934 family)
MNNVKVSIKGMQTQDDDTNDVELFTEGKFEKSGNKYVLIYKESEMTGFEGTTTTVEIENEKVSIIRSGNVSNQMIFLKGKKTTSYYNTQFGSLVIGVMTDKMDVDVGDDGGKIDINYILDINEEFIGQNNVQIDIKKA